MIYFATKVRTAYVPWMSVWPAISSSRVGGTDKKNRICINLAQTEVLSSGFYSSLCKNKLFTLLFSTFLNSVGSVDFTKKECLIPEQQLLSSCFISPNKVLQTHKLG